ncbi:MAG TPA: phosphoribosylanthranilate isomerase, partial [Caldithrix sp.]|nr:phosphoribosylanthranilate isomerase [Caldithrix sp.]
MFFSNKIIQVAGVRNAAEAKMLIACGVKFLGFPLRLDVHSQDLSEAAAAKIIRNLPDGVTAVLITYLKTAREIAELSGKLGTAAVQIHGQIAPSEITELRKNTSDLQIIKSLVVHGDNFPE